jgi:hypothetical protein
MGPQGLQGNDGAKGADGTGFSFKGPFDKAASYATNDVVSFNGSSYVATAAENVGDPAPDVNPNWSGMAKQGADGSNGAAGQPGQAATITVGSTRTLPPDSLASVANIGTSGAAVLNFAIPQGPLGPQGPPGTPPPNVAVTNAANTFAASQTINGNLMLGAGGAIQFGDGTMQSSAFSGGSGVPSGYMILSSSPVPPAGYTPAGSMLSGDLWSFVAPLPTPRYHLAAASANGRIYAIGGRDNNNVILNTLDVYDPSTNSWSIAAPMPTARQDLAAASLNGKIYVMGGQDAGGRLGTVEVYDPSTNSWSTAASLPTPRFGLAAAIVNGQVYAIGGLNGGGPVDVYDPATNSWRAAAPLLRPRAYLAAVALGGKIYAIGGLDLIGIVSNRVEVYDLSTDTWSATTPMLTPRQQLAAATVNGKIYVIGGDDGTALAGTVNVLNFTNLGAIWTTAAPLLKGGTSLAAADTNGFIYALGGAIGSVLNTVEQYSQPVTLYTFLKN